jgi:hypothetical protein
LIFKLPPDSINLQPQEQTTEKEEAYAYKQHLAGSGSPYFWHPDISFPHFVELVSGNLLHSSWSAYHPEKVIMIFCIKEVEL